MEERTEEPIAIKNKDIPLLASTISIMREIEQLEERREWQKERMFNITQHITGMPSGGGGAKGFDGVLANLSELDEKHESRCAEYTQKLRMIERILNGIESSTMRAFVELKYVMGRPDAEVRSKLNMTRRGYDRARKCVEDASCMATVKWIERYILA